MTDYNREIKDLEESKKTIRLQKAFPSEEAKVEREKISRTVLGAGKKTADVAKKVASFARAPKAEKIEIVKQVSKEAFTRGKSAAKTVALQGPGYAAAPYKAIVSEKGAGYVGGAAGIVARGVMQPLKKGISIKIAFPKGVVHPDSLIHRRELYFTSNPQMTPTGKFMTDWRDLYFLKKKSVPPEAQGVYGALQEGYTDMDQITVVTGLTPQQVSQGYNYLKRKNMLPENIEEKEVLA